MKNNIVFIYFLIITFSLSPTVCISCLGQNEMSTDTINIEGFKIIPLKAFDYNGNLVIKEDTLFLVTCCNFVFYPFGKLTNKHSLKKSIFKNWTIKKYKRESFKNTNLAPPVWEFFEYVQVTFGKNRLSFFFDNDPEASTHGYISKGEIWDNKVELLQHIKVGMDINTFCSKFFVNYPPELYKRFRVISFISCISDITQHFTFKNEKLSNIKFIPQP